MPLQTLSAHWWVVDIVIFIVALGLACIGTILCKQLAAWTGFMDRPKAEAHKKHVKATPLLGGIALFSAWAVTILGGMLAGKLIPSDCVNPEIAKALNNLSDPKAFQGMLVVACGGLFATLLGLWDDWKALSAGKKLLGQILIAAFAVYFGNMQISFFFHIPLLNIAVTIFWFVLIFNAINFFDNMDGLAVGTSCIALSLFTLTAIITGQYYVAAISAAGAGATLGFWFFNHSPASIFMGDSGSHFLAYLLAAVSVKITYMTPESGTYLAPMIPLFILALPLYDVLAVVVIRRSKGLPVYKGDHNHVSHRFVAIGMSRKMAVMAVHLLSLIIGLGVLPLIWGSMLTSLVLIGQGVLLLTLVSVLQYTSRKTES